MRTGERIPNPPAKFGGLEVFQRGPVVLETDAEAFYLPLSFKLNKLLKVKLSADGESFEPY